MAKPMRRMEDLWPDLDRWENEGGALGRMEWVMPVPDGRRQPLTERERGPDLILG